MLHSGYPSGIKFKSISVNTFRKFSDAAEEGVFRNYYSGDIVDLGFGIANSVLDGGQTENCAILVPLWKGWNDWSCVINAAQPITCACEHPHQMYLQLRGLCPSSTIDQFYVPRNKKRVGSVILIGKYRLSKICMFHQSLGFKNTIIEYVKANFSWKMNVYGAARNTTASSESSYTSYLLGSHNWLIENDDIDCSPKGESYSRTLKLTGCKEGEFTCYDGQCIRREIIVMYY